MGALHTVPSRARNPSCLPETTGFWTRSHHQGAFSASHFEHGAILLGLAEEPNPWPAGHMWPRMARNVAQHRIINLLKTFFFLLISFH